MLRALLFRREVSLQRVFCLAETSMHYLAVAADPYREPAFFLLGVTVPG